MAGPGGGRADVFTALRECRLWRAADDDAVARLAAQARVTDLPSGSRLVTEGEAAGSFGVMVVGRARVFHLGADGRRFTFEDVGSGDPVAAVAALAGSRYPANVETVTPATVAWLPREALFELMAEEPDVARNIVADLARRVVNFTSVVQTLALDVPSRLARYLFERALAAGQATTQGLQVDLGMSKNELAAALGTVPETLSRAFARLRDEGLVDVHGRRVVVRDVGALARMGAGYEEG
ncbi:MAG: Crp/Fnr family transcriptional regulator [Coriobacteriia bacterium]|nr:Crp/Fnr family transcriptional regulator [Coriobacteriia bacterium]